MATVKPKTLITHNGSFHSDDIFAAAMFALLFEKKGEAFEIIRTRDIKVIERGDYVFDVGGIYDEKLNRFDHHQKGGAGKRANGIEYSSFGLVWKKFGVELSESKEVADFIDQRLVTPIDANDNAINLYKNNFENISPYTINDVFSIFSPTALENLDKDEQFFKVLVWAKEILSREIKKAQDKIKISDIIRDFYKKSPDKRLIVVDKPKVSRYEIWDALQEFPEPLFAVYGRDTDWSAVAMRKEMNSFSNRKNFPASWAGLKDKELQKKTGVADALFCHNTLFLVVAASKEGAMKLAQIAVESQ